MTKKPPPFDWGVWLRSFGVYILGMVGCLVAFYFSTTNTLQNHEKQFVEIGKKFDSFNETLKRNYDDWAKSNKVELEKAEIRAKEERDIRDKMRTEFQQTFGNFAASAAGMRVQVDTIGKQLDSLTGKIDAISTVQQQNRSLINERGTRR